MHPIQADRVCSIHTHTHTHTLSHTDIHTHVPTYEYSYTKMNGCIYKRLNDNRDVLSPIECIIRL